MVRGCWEHHEPSRVAPRYLGGPRGVISGAKGSKEILMELKRDGYLLRFYWWGESRWDRGDTVDLCSLFWMVLFKGILCAIGLTALGLLAALIYTEIGRFFLVAVALAAILAVASGVAATVQAIGQSETYAFIKGNYCPQIKVKD